MNVLKIVFAAACGVTFLFLAASTGGPTWLDYESGSSYGIFRYCVKNIFNDDTVCENYDASGGDGTLKAIRAFAVLAVLATVVAVILAAIGICVEKIPPIIPAIIMGVAGFCALIAGAIYADENGEGVKKFEFVKYGWSFALCWVGMVTAFISAALGFLVHKKK